MFYKMGHLRTHLPQALSLHSLQLDISQPLSTSTSQSTLQSPFFHCDSDGHGRHAVQHAVATICNPPQRWTAESVVMYLQQHTPHWPF